ncbi:uncharacterized protein A4U43_C07F4950 [Asparagus officinalis]|uniref:Uncharacterized protein n=1 Tax=Asparagus officinalis TaxID=4686 RepID=A0A5P1ECS6_ASPOF|nr:uncharacterized protein A4U43_C07F4950 [Asparagus officinalis]
MLRFTVQLQHHARHHLPTFQLIFVHVIESLVFVPIMIGILFFLFEFYDDQLLLYRTPKHSSFGIKPDVPWKLAARRGDHGPQVPAGGRGVEDEGAGKGGGDAGDGLGNAGGMVVEMRISNCRRRSAWLFGEDENEAAALFGEGNTGFLHLSPCVI